MNGRGPVRARRKEFEREVAARLDNLERLVFDLQEKFLLVLQYDCLDDPDASGIDLNLSQDRRSEDPTLAAAMSLQIDQPTNDHDDGAAAPIDVAEERSSSTTSDGSDNCSTWQTPLPPPAHPGEDPYEVSAVPQRLLSEAEAIAAMEVELMVEAMRALRAGGDAGGPVPASKVDVSGFGGCDDVTDRSASVDVVVLEDAVNNESSPAHSSARSTRDSRNGAQGAATKPYRQKLERRWTPSP